MQTVSQAWKDAHNERLLPENYLEITVEVADPESMSDGTATDNGAASISNTHNVTGGVYYIPPRYATFELNSWVLDKSLAQVQDTNPKNTGYIGSALSGEDGVFANPPTLIVNFSKVYDRLIPGVTITWSEEFGEFPVSFKVTAYNGQNVVSERTITGNRSVATPIEIDISGYNRIEVAILEWCLPRRRARISEFFPGLQKLYKKSDIMCYNISTEIFPLSDKLPKYETDFEISNISGEYDPNNPQGMTKYLMERQALNVKYGMKVGEDVEYIAGGRFYLSEWKSPQNGITATFRARDALEYMRGTYYKGVYSSSGETLYALAEAVLIDAGLPLLRDGSTPWVIDESLKSVTTTAPLPIGTHAECLQLIANAGCCVLTVDREGRIKIAPTQSDQTEFRVNSFNSYKKPELKLSKQLKSVSVDVYSYFGDSTSMQLYSGTVSISGKQKITVEYTEGARNVKATVGGGTLVSAQYYSYACVLEISGSGNVTVTVTGTPLKKSKSALALVVGNDGETESLSNPLVTSSGLAAQIAAYIASVLINRRTFDLDWRADTRIDVGDSILVDNQYGAETANITKLKLAYTGAFHATGTARATPTQ